MAEHWIDANTAYRLIADVTYPSSAANEVLCRRAYAGLLRTRARLLVIAERQKTENVDVPAGFWWAKGQAALKQNWVSGDFSTKTQDRAEARWEAFGVTFALSDLLDLLPFELRTGTARRLSIIGNPA